MKKKKGFSKKQARAIRAGLGILIGCTAVLIVMAVMLLLRGRKESEPEKPDESGSPVTAQSSAENDESRGPEDVTLEPQEETTPEEDGPKELTKAQWTAQQIESMDLRQKVSQLFIVTPEELLGRDGEEEGFITSADPAVREMLEEYPVAGLIYFEDNLTDISGTKEMLKGMKRFGKEVNGLPLFMSVDEEGGTVARCADKLGTTALKSMYEYKDQGTAKAYDNACVIASDISRIGFDLDFAPVADTWSNKDNTVIGKRAYSDDYKQTAELSSAAVRGFGDCGVMCCIKHFPGHGDTSGDSHTGRVYSYKTVEELAENEYLAFAAGISSGADMVMVGHITMPSVDGRTASLSPVMIEDELRGRLGYKGLVITDSLEMDAVADLYDTCGELAVAAFKAGNDLLLCPRDLSGAVDALEKAVESGEISEERLEQSLTRILSLKYDRL